MPAFTRRRRILLAATLVLLVVTAGTVVSLTRSSETTSAGDAVQGPKFPAARVTEPAGNVVTCPLGSVPYVNITEAYFTPRLAGGTSFLPGITYRIRLTGTVANEPTAPITIIALRPRTGAAAWRGARFRAPTKLSANSSGKLEVQGTYRVTKVAQASLSAHMTWRWSEQRLAACGERGLIDDD
jgi:hypothetical protein